MVYTVARVTDIPDGEAIRRTIDGREIALFRRGGEVFAIDATCPHRRGPLDGPLENDYQVVCPWHGWVFDVRTGISPVQPARVACHKVTLEGEDIHVELFSLGGGHA